MKMVKSATPCKICKGKQKIQCIICGWKAPKEAKKPKEITREDRRSDFLGGIYNWMRKCNMPNTGLVGDVNGEVVIIIEDRGNEIEILDFVGRWIVSHDLVKNIRQNKADVEILKRFGNPHDSTARPYELRYKLRKNEV